MEQAHNCSAPNQGHDQLSMSLHGHKHLIDQCQINGHDQLSMSSTDTSMPSKRQTNGQDQLSTASKDTSMQLSMPNQLQLIHLEQGQDYSLAVISM